MLERMWWVGDWEWVRMMGCGTSGERVVRERAVRVGTSEEVASREGRVREWGEGSSLSGTRRESAASVF